MSKMMFTIATMLGLASGWVDRPYEAVPEEPRNKGFRNKNQLRRHQAPARRRKGIGKRGFKR